MIQFDYSSIDIYNQDQEIQLSSVIGEDNFFYGLFIKGKHKLMAAKLLTDLPKAYYLDSDYLEALFERENLYHPKITSAHFSFATEHFSLIPSSIIVKDKELYAESFTGLYHDERYIMKSQLIEALDIDLFYMLPQQLNDFVQSKYKKPHVCHLNGALINELKDKAGTYIFFNFFNKRLQTIVVKNGKLFQSNDYYLKGKDDALYYALLNCKTFDFDPENDQFYLAGTHDVGSIQMELFLEHFKYLDLLGKNDRLSYANVFLGKSKHMFFDLECVASCV